MPADRCAFCAEVRLAEVIDLGQVALAGGFLRPEQFPAERCHPLRLGFCENCCALQVLDRIDARVLFSDYFYFSSSIRTLREHFERYADEVVERFLTPERATVIEFGCNDGVWLRPLADRRVRTVIGVDPASNVVRTIDDSRVTVINDFFTEKVAADIVGRHGRADLVSASNVYAHIPDIQEVTRAVRQVLKDDGVFIFEVHYLGNLVEEMQYDMIYHEHLYYYSLLSAIHHFDRHGLTVFDVKRIPLHAGSARFYVCKSESRRAAETTERVRALLAEERTRGYDQAETFRRYAARMGAHRASLRALLESLRSQGRTIAGYGASGRANTMIQYCGIDRSHLEYMIDDAPAKIGFHTPGSHFLIRSNSVLESPEAPDFLLVFAWSFLDEIARRSSGYLARGGQLIVPLPEPRIVPAEAPTPGALAGR